MFSDLEIKEWLRIGENETLEFKKKLSHPEKVMREVVAFANTNGGILLIGILDSGEIAGVKDVEEEEYIFHQSVKSLCQPKINYDLQKIELDEGKMIIVCTIEEGINKPYRAKETVSQKSGIAYIRVKDRSIQASEEWVLLSKMMAENAPPYIKIGENEKAILEKISKSSTGLTKDQITKQLTILPHKISQILVKMVYSNLISLHPHEKGDIFRSKDNL